MTDSVIFIYSDKCDRQDFINCLEKCHLASKITITYTCTSIPILTHTLNKSEFLQTVVRLFDDRGLKLLDLFTYELICSFFYWEIIEFLCYQITDVSN